MTRFSVSKSLWMICDVVIFFKIDIYARNLRVMESSFHARSVFHFKFCTHISTARSA